MLFRISVSGEDMIPDKVHFVLSGTFDEGKISNVILVEFELDEEE